MIFSVNDEKKAKIKELSKDMLSSNKVTIRKLAKKIGNLVASFAAVGFSRLHYRHLRKVNITGLKYPHSNFD